MKVTIEFKDGLKREYETSQEIDDFCAKGLIVQMGFHHPTIAEECTFLCVVDNSPKFFHLLGSPID